MNIARNIVEKSAGLRYRRAKLLTPLLRAALGRVGADTVVIAPSMISGAENIYLGDRVLMRDGAWLATEGAGSSLTVGDDCYMGHRVHLHSIDPVSIGSGCVFADNVMVSTTDHEAGDRHAVRGTGPIVIGDHVFLGQNVVVLGGVTIGSGATVAAGAVVVSDVEPGATVGGVPAKRIGASA